MFDKLIVRVHTQAQLDLDEQLRKQRSTIQASLSSFMSEPQLRRRIRRGLLKVDELHSLARDVYYGRRGRINARELHEQMNSCSCLTLILACIIYWQAQEIDRVLNEGDPGGNSIDLSLLEHVSPIEWENVVLYGEYILNRELIRH